MRESGVERVLTELVRSRGGVCMKIAPVMAGAPDRLVLLPGGRVYLVETKTERGSLRPIQRVWHDRAAALGTEVVVLHGAGQVRAWLQEVAPGATP